MGSRVVLGMSSTVDEELRWDERVVEALVIEHGIVPADLDRPGPVVDERSMVVALLGHLVHGTGAEHYVSAPALLFGLVARFESRRTLGGTGVRAGIALAATGVESVAVMAAADPDVHRLLPPLCRPVAAAEVAALVPHVIVQYPGGAVVRVGDLTIVTPAPNRVIFAHDVPNEELLVPASFPELVARADVVLVSSLNAIRDERLLAQRLASIGDALSGAPAGATLIWEDAAYHIQTLALEVTRTMAAHVHVVSMNEDEMQAHLTRHVDLLDPRDVSTAVRDAAELVGARTLVVHTRWWSAAVGTQAERYRAAVRGGIAMASARYAFGDDIDVQRYDEALTWPIDPRSLRLAAALEAAGMVCEPGVLPPTATPTTIGLGDTFAGGMVRALASDRVDRPPTAPGS